MTGPSNAEFFRFLEEDLSFSLFRRSGEALISFKETIEFVLLPDATTEGPEEGLLFEGITSLSAADWRELIAGFVISTVDSRIDLGGGSATRVFRATKQLGTPVALALATHPHDGPDLDRLESSAAPVREELRAEDSRFVWIGPSSKPDCAGWLTVHARRIACRGTDKGMPASIIFREKLRQYRLRREPTG